MRLDKFLTEMNIGTRSEVKQLLKKKQISVNGSIDLKPEQKIDPERDCIKYQNQILHYEKYIYYMLNKPAGIVSATEDRADKTVIDLFAKEPVRGLFPVGRLDKDTEGLLLITNDGAFAHEALSPKKHVQKCYYAILDHQVDEHQIEDFSKGINIGDEKITLPAILQPLADQEDGHGVLIWITEGRYHQVKRMFAAYGQNVLYLKRMSMGNLQLSPELPAGAYRKLTAEEAAMALEQSPIKTSCPK